MAVEANSAIVYLPDALARCGEPLPDDAVKVTEPVIVVEVLSPSSRAHDTGAKFEDYFRLASVRHYLIIKTENRTVVHHRRDADGTIQTSIVRRGALLLEPPGLPVAVRIAFPRGHTVANSQRIGVYLQA